MDWVEGLDRHDGRLVARAAGTDQLKRLVDLNAMRLTGMTSARLRRARIDTDLGTWSTSSAREYLAGFGLDLDVEERHQVFAITHDGIRYLIPALVLMQAIFRPFHLLANFLFVPHGLELLCTPDLTGNEPSVHLMRGTLDTHSRRRASIRQPLSWFWCFPTARNCWDSCYSYACKGQLAMDLPIGSIRLVIKGKLLEGTCYVTECSTIQVNAQEHPHEFAKDHCTLITFHDGTNLGDARRGKRSRPTPLSDSKLLIRDGIWDLSNEEWAAIKPIVTIATSNPDSYRKHDLRFVLDGIIEKIGTGIPWQKMRYKAGDWCNAHGQYRKLLLSGQWENIRKVLAETRTPLGAP